MQGHTNFVEQAKVLGGSGIHDFLCWRVRWTVIRPRQYHIFGFGLCKLGTREFPEDFTFDPAVHVDHRLQPETGPTSEADFNSLKSIQASTYITTQTKPHHRHQLVKTKLKNMRVSRTAQIPHANNRTRSFKIFPMRSKNRNQIMACESPIVHPEKRADMMIHC